MTSSWSESGWSTYVAILAQDTLLPQLQDNTFMVAEPGVGEVILQVDCPPAVQP